MHEVYKKIWNVADKTDRDFSIYKQIMVPVLQHSIVGSYRADSRWCYFGNPLFGEQWHELVKWQIVIAAYIAMIIGFAGGIMYILRNTEPKDIK